MKPSGLVRYDAMRQSIAEWHRIDEVKDLRDKAKALEAYASRKQRGRRQDGQSCRANRQRRPDAPNDPSSQPLSGSAIAYWKARPLPRTRVA
jgi:hypothetical protein